MTAKAKTSVVRDIDGNVYKTVKIGNQIWMAKNLKTTKYRDGAAIPNVTHNAEWAGLSTGAYCYYDNDVGNSKTYGALYNWYAVNNASGLAPEGWHVATDDEWKELEMFLGMSQSTTDSTGYRGTEGEKLKSTNGWYDDGNGTDAVGFNAFPSGYRHNLHGTFYSMGTSALFWSASESSATVAWRRLLSYNNVAVYRSNLNKGHGYSVRCVKD